MQTIIQSTIDALSAQRAQIDIAIEALRQLAAVPPPVVPAVAPVSEAPRRSTKTAPSSSATLAGCGTRSGPATSR